jgi:hypothetical protein
MAHRKGVVRHRDNPFLKDNTVSTRKKRVTVSAAGRAVMNLETGELEDAAEIVMVRNVDDEQFVKLFTQNLRLFFDLSSGTIKLLQVLLSQVQRAPNTDKVMLNVAIAQDYFTETPDVTETMSKASFFRAVKELLDKQFIAETMLSGLFFINPSLFFNGDRVRFVNEIRRNKANDEYAQTVKRMRSSAPGRGSQGRITDDGAERQIDLEDWLQASVAQPEEVS